MMKKLDDHLKMTQTIIEDDDVDLSGEDLAVARQKLHRLLSQAYIDGRTATERERKGDRDAWEGGHWYANRIVKDVIGS